MSAPVKPGTVLPNDRYGKGFDAAASLKEADARLGLQRLLEQNGFGPTGAGETWKKFKCPFCQEKTAGVFSHKGSGTPMFKCQRTTCPTAAKAMPAVQFLAHQANLSNRDAFEAYLKQAGVWKERTRYQPPLQDKPASVDQAAGTATDGHGQTGTANADDAPPWDAANAAAEAAVEPAGEIANCKSQIAAPAEAAGPAGAVAAAEPALEIANCKSQISPSSAGPTEGGPSSAGPTEGGPSSAPVAAPSSAKATEGRPSSAAPTEGGAVVKSAGDGWAGLRDFYGRGSLSARDEEVLWKKRGLESRTALALGFISGGRANRKVLEELHDRHGFEELRAAGLWLSEDRKRRSARRPNAQFCGAGLKRKFKAGDRLEKGEWLDEDGHVWGWTEPVLIPYFDANGELVSLRPHKGMGRAGTLVGAPRLYVPRGFVVARAVARRLAGLAPEPERELFPAVVITEGEFKAAALWQTVGAGRTDGGPAWGVGAVPGISFWNHFEVREQLEDWLRTVKCGRVVIAFDSEEKGVEGLPGYQPDPEKRHDSVICARCLAESLHRKAHVKSQICVLPRNWRNAHGKADWDGALADLVHKNSSVFPGTSTAGYAEYAE